MKTRLATTWNANMDNRLKPLKHMIAGVFAPISIFKRAETRKRRLAPAPYLSRASKCVWQMDREG